MPHDDYDHLRASADEATKKRFWVYSHDEQGEIITNYGEVATMADAIDVVAHALVSLYPQYNNTSLRIVDNEKDSTTVWAAGPVTHVDGRATI